jgi:hypothetical protein
MIVLLAATSLMAGTLPDGVFRLGADVRSIPGSRLSAIASDSFEGEHIAAPSSTVAPRLTIRYDVANSVVAIIGRDVAMLASSTADAHAAVADVPPATYDIFVFSPVTAATSTNAGVEAIIVASGVEVTDDTQLTLDSSSATHVMRFSGVDQKGRRLADLPRSGTQHYLSRIRISRTDSTLADNVLEFAFDGIDTLRSGTIPERYAVRTAEAYVDWDAHTLYAEQYPQQNGVSATSTSFTTTASSLRHAGLQFATPRSASDRRIRLSWSTVEAQPAQSLAISTDAPFGSDWRGDLYLNDEPDETLTNSMTISIGSPGSAPELITLPFRAKDGRVFLSGNMKPSPATYFAAADETLTFGLGLLHPFAFFGTSVGYGIGTSPAGMNGVLGEQRPYDTRRALFTMSDATGHVVEAGPINRVVLSDGTPGRAITTPEAGWSYSSSLDFYVTTDVVAKSELSTTFGSDPYHLSAPTLTSLALRDSNDRNITSLTANAPASLVFSAAAYAFDRGFSTHAPRAEMTRVSWRPAGSNDWQPLTVTTTSTDLDSTASMPAFGTTFRADLAPLVASSTHMADLRIELEDEWGNTTSWTLGSGIVIGDPSTAPPRSRSRR